MIVAVLLVATAMLFDRFVPVSLAVTAVVLLTWQYGFRVSFPVAFGLGVWDDLVWMRTLGVASVALLILGLIISLAKAQMEERVGLLVAVSGVLGELIWQALFGFGLDIWWLLLQALLCYGIYVVMQLMGPRGGVYLRR